MKFKVRIVACSDNFHFIQDLIPALSDEFDIKKVNSTDRKTIINELYEADLIWLEWADGISIDIIKTLFLSPHFSEKKTILRLHRYELFTPRTIMQIKLLPIGSIGRIDKLVFVSKTVQQIGVDKFPWMKNSVVIPNLMDHTKFPFTDRERGYNIMMLGRMSYVKNLPLALTMFNGLYKIDPRYKLHIVGEISDPELVYYLDNFIRKTRCGDIRYHGRIDNDKLPEFMKDMRYILCSSVFESFGMGILEAMCCGLKPVVFDFPGAENIFPTEWCWLDFEQFERIINSGYEPMDYHNFVYENYSIEKNIHLYKEIINNVLN